MFIKYDDKATWKGHSMINPDMLITVGYFILFVGYGLSLFVGH